MPQVAYQCRQCGERFERVVFLGDKPVRPRCPACGSGDVEASAGAEPLFDGISSFSSLARDRN